MAFKKFYKKYKKNGGYYKYRSKLSKSNIFGKKSAKSQAKQIYALNKKVNKIERSTRPETRIYTGKVYNKILTTTGAYGGYGLKEWHGYTFLYNTSLFGDSAEGYADYVMEGNNIRMHDITLYGYFGNKNHVAQIGSTLYESIPMTGYLKIIVVRLSRGEQQGLPTKICKPFDFNENPDLGLINGPLVPNISSTVDILKTKVIKVNNTRQDKFFKIKIKNPGIYRKAPSSGGDNNRQNEIVVYFQYYCPDQLFADGYTGEQPVAPIQRFECYAKFAFVDDN